LKFGTTGLRLPRRKRTHQVIQSPWMLRSL